MRSLADRMRGRTVSPEAWAKGLGGVKASQASGDGTTVTFDDVVVVRETEAAWYLRGVSSAPVWIPKSVATLDGGVLTVAAWFAAKERLS